MKKIIFATACLFLFSNAAFADNLVGDASNGESLFEHHCTACHSLTSNRVGPNLAGVYGRKVGSAQGFTYSNALKNSTVIWTEENLDKWLTSPASFIPGQRMNFSISDAQKRADIIAFLKTQK